MNIHFSFSNFLFHHQCQFHAPVFLPQFLSYPNNKHNTYAIISWNMKAVVYRKKKFLYFPVVMATHQASKQSDEKYKKHDTATERKKGRKSYANFSSSQPCQQTLKENTKYLQLISIDWKLFIFLLLLLFFFLLSVHFNIPRYVACLIRNGEYFLKEGWMWRKWGKGKFINEKLLPHSKYEKTIGEGREKN